jgi:23S rRNA (uracil1939-C5)-methyltransferase
MKLRIEKAIYGGAGLARSEGKAIFVPFTLPGEEVDAHIAEDKAGYATAELDAIIEPSAERVAPPCLYFGSCGGCHYQHAAYSAQVEMKIAILRETLERAKIREIPDIDALSGEPFAYRNRVRLHVQNNPLSLCYKRRNSHANLPVGNCPVAAPALQRAIGILNQDGAKLDLASGAGEVEIFANSDESALLVSFFTQRSAAEAERWLKKTWPQFKQILPALAGAAMFSSEKGRQPSKFIAQTGESSLRYTSGNAQYQVSLGSFFQVNRFLIGPLVQRVNEGERGSAAWDLYAGVGLFSVPLAAQFAAVTSVESAAGSVRDLRLNLRGPEHRVVAAETASFLRRALDQRIPAPDLIVVDPPRAGLGRDVTTMLGKLRAPRITYVSCDPATLSRDLAALLESGYRLRKMQMVDLFPQTFHLESITHLALD